MNTFHCLQVTWRWSRSFKIQTWKTQHRYTVSHERQLLISKIRNCQKKMCCYIIVIWLTSRYRISLYNITIILSWLFFKMKISIYFYFEHNLCKAAFKIRVFFNEKVCTYWYQIKINFQQCEVLTPSHF